LATSRGLPFTESNTERNKLIRFCLV
jgi:hypothetical protein